MKYRYALPHLNGKRMLTDGGLETTLIFQDGIDLPLFAAFLALETEKGVKALDRYMRKFAELAVRDGCGFIMDTPTWRASPRWAAELDVSLGRLKDLHRCAVDQLCHLRNELETPASPFVLNGAIGPQGDGYAPTEILSADAAETYHQTQVQWFAEMGADMVSAVIQGFRAFWEGRYDEAVGTLHRARFVANSFGGSHAQRDIIDWTLTEAAVRSGNSNAAEALANERIAVKPHSPINKRFLRRASLSPAQSVAAE